MRWFPSFPSFPFVPLLVGVMLPALLLASATTAAAQPGPSGPALDAAHLQELVDQLGSDRYTIRRRAERRLRHAGRPAVPMLIDALANSRDAEVTFRVQSILTGIGEDFLVLCAHLSDRNPRVRLYAEESLAMRLMASTPPAINRGQRLVPNQPQGVQQQQMLHGEVRYVQPLPRRQPFSGQRMTVGQGFDGTAWEFLRDVLDPQVPVAVMPAAWDHPGMFQRVQLASGDAGTVQMALDELTRQVGLQFLEGQFGGAQAVVVTSGTPGARTGTTERDVVLGVCAAVWHDLPDARRASCRMLGLYYGHGEDTRDMLVKSLGQQNNPLHDDLVTALMMSGQPMSVCLPLVPEGAVAAVARMMRDENATWMTRQAAARALLTWVPAAPPPGPERGPRAERHRAAIAAYQAERDAWQQHVVPVLEASLAVDAPPVPKYLALWAVGALRGQWPDDTVAGRIVAAVASALHSEHPEIARQALQSLGWLAPQPPPPGAVDRALELGFQTDDTALREAALDFLRTARSDRLFATVLERYRNLLQPDDGEEDDDDAPPLTADQARALRLFLATLLSEATDITTLRGVLQLVLIEEDDEAITLMTRAFSEKVTDASLWDALLPLLTHDKRPIRRAGTRVLLRTKLPAREDRVRELLAAAEAADRKVELQIVLFRLGDEGLLEVLVNAFRSDDEALALEAATGLGETMSDDALSIFRDAFGAELVTTRLAAVQGLDAFGRACAESGNVEKVRGGYQLLFNFGRDQSDAVRNLARDVRDRYSGTNGYRAMADRMRNAARTPDQPASTYPVLPPEPRDLLTAGTDSSED